MADLEEHVLVIPSRVVDAIGVIDGFEPDVERFADQILGSAELSFQPRSRMETDPSFKQLIPYVVLQWTDAAGLPHVFAYTRGGGGGETRLHALRSIGIGGHISREDARDGADPYTAGMHRELAEEIELKADYKESREGLLYDPSNEVGRVHLGVVHRLVLDAPRVTARETDLADGGFVPVDELRRQSERLETWSQLTLEALFR